MIAKANERIALLNITGKTLKFVIAKLLIHLLKANSLLPQIYFWVCRSSSTEYALHYLIKKIQFSWNIKEIATVFSLDTN